jgi:hypothetical protein
MLLFDALKVSHLPVFSSWISQGSRIPCCMICGLTKQSNNGLFLAKYNFYELFPSHLINRKVLIPMRISNSEMETELQRRNVTLRGTVDGVAPGCE